MPRRPPVGVDAIRAWGDAGSAAIPSISREVAEKARAARCRRRASPCRRRKAIGSPSLDLFEPSARAAVADEKGVEDRDEIPVETLLAMAESLPGHENTVGRRIFVDRLPERSRRDLFRSREATPRSSRARVEREIGAETLRAALHVPLKYRSKRKKVLNWSRVELGDAETPALHTRREHARPRRTTIRQLKVRRAALAKPPGFPIWTIAMACGGKP